MAPAPKPTPTGVDIHVPVNVPSGGFWGIFDHVTGLQYFGIAAAILVIIGLGAYMVNRLPWKPIAIVLGVILLMVFVFGRR